MDLEESRNRLNQSVAYYSFESPPNVAKVRQFPSILCSIPYPNVAKDLLLRQSVSIIEITCFFPEQSGGKKQVH